MTKELAQKRKYGKDIVEKIPEYKMKVLKKVLESDVIAKLLYYKSADALFRPDLTEEQKDELLYKNVYPYRFMPDTIEVQDSFITFDIGRIRALEVGYDIFDDYKNGQVTFYLFTHTELMRTHSGIRQDLILAELSKLFNKDRTLGIGELNIRGVEVLYMHNNKFGGYTLSFTIIDV